MRKFLAGLVAGLFLAGGAGVWAQAVRQPTPLAAGFYAVPPMTQTLISCANGHVPMSNALTVPYPTGAMPAIRVSCL